MAVVNTDNLYQPHAVFPGDQAISPEIYEACMQGRYSSVLAGAVGAVESFGVETDAESIENWKRVAIAGGMLDTFLDESPDRDEAVRLYKAGTACVSGHGEMPERPEWADPLLEPAIILMHNAVRRLPDDRQTTLLNAADVIADISVAKASASNVSEYKRLLRAEGKLSGLLVSESASQQLYEDPRYEQFALWVMNLMEAATMADSAIDLRQDFTEQLTAVKPSALNAVRIAMGGVKATRFILHSSANRRAVKDAVMANRAFAAAGDAT